jgi:hypothetical protein
MSASLTHPQNEGQDTTCIFLYTNQLKSSGDLGRQGVCIGMGLVWSGIALAHHLFALDRNAEALRHLVSDDLIGHEMIGSAKLLID